MFFLFLVVFLLQTFIKYTGNNHGFYNDLYQYLLYPGTYLRDLYIQKSFVFESCTFFPLVRFLRLDLDNDYVGYVFSVLLATVSLTAFYAVLRKVFGIKDRALVYVLLLLMVLLSTHRLMAGSPYSGLIFGHSCTQSQLAHQLSFVYLYLLTVGRFLWANLLLTFILTLTLKSFWVLVPIGILYAIFTGGFFPKTHRGSGIRSFLFSREHPLDDDRINAGPRKVQHRKASVKNIFYFFIPVLIMAGRYFYDKVGNLSADQGTLLQMCHIIFRRNGEEDAFQFHSPMALVSYVLSFVMYFHLMRFFKGKALALAKGVFYVGLLNVLALGLYAFKGYVWHANPVLILLSPVRSMNFYILFLYLLFFIVFLKSSLPEGIKTLFVVFFILFVNVDRNLLTSAFLSVLFVATIVLIRRPELGQTLADGLTLVWGKLGSFFPRKWTARLPCRKNYAILMLFFLLLSFGKAAQRLESIRRTTPVVNKWSHEKYFSPGLKQSLLQLREDKEDYVLLTLTPARGPSGNLINEPFFNWVARKSKFVGDYAHFYLDVKSYQVHLGREEKLQKLMDELNAGKKISEDIAAYLRSERVRILLPADDAGLLGEAKTVRDLGAFTLVSYDY